MYTDFVIFVLHGYDLIFGRLTGHLMQPPTQTEFDSSLEQFSFIDLQNALYAPIMFQTLPPWSCSKGFTFQWERGSMQIGPGGECCEGKYIMRGEHTGWETATGPGLPVK